MDLVHGVLTNCAVHSIAVPVPCGVFAGRHLIEIVSPATKETEFAVSDATFAVSEIVQVKPVSRPFFKIMNVHDCTPAPFSGATFTLVYKFEIVPATGMICEASASTVATM